jgi:hypothetical protein
LPQLLKLYAKFRDRVLFKVVYIAEAHAADEWPIGSRDYTAKQPKSFAERLAIQRAMQEEFKLPWKCVFDKLPRDAFMFEYGAWPTRFFVFQRGKLVFKADPIGCTYLVIHLERALDKLLLASSSSSSSPAASEAKA